MMRECVCGVVRECVGSGEGVECVGGGEGVCVGGGEGVGVWSVCGGR